MTDQEVTNLELLLDEKPEKKAEIFDNKTPKEAYDLLVYILQENLLEPIVEKIVEGSEKYFSKAEWEDILPDLKGDEKDKMKHIAYCVASCRLGEAFNQKIEQYEKSHQDYDGTHLCLEADEQISAYINKLQDEAEQNGKRK